MNRYSDEVDTTRTGFLRRGRYDARPGRRAVVVPDLDELRGPTSGVVELPNRLFWQPDKTFDLDNPALLKFMYEVVLCEAASVEELRAWLDGDTLVRVWPSIFVPRGVRLAWEQRHPQLRTSTVAAAAA